MSQPYRLAVLPGEGIGPEVIRAACDVLAALSELEDFRVEFRNGAIGQAAFDACGEPLSQETIALCESADAILFGAIERYGILELRRQFGFYANLRPVRLAPCLTNCSSLKPDVVAGLDILFVRELVSGIYFGSSGRGHDEDGPFGFHTMRYHDHEIRRVARVAIDKARIRRGRLTVAHKENALPQIPWRRLVEEEAARLEPVTVEPMLVDTLAMELVRDPNQFDVILAGNLFGDILSDIGGSLVGSLGMLPSASLNEHGFGLYEPVHGTAPSLAGRGVANPLGAVGAVEMMLEQWGQTRAANRLRLAVESVLAQGCHTADLIRDGRRAASTREMTEAIIRELSDTAAQTAAAPTRKLASALPSPA